MWNQCCFITSILKSLVIVAVWLALIGAIYLRIAHLTINLQESEIYFDNFTNDLQTSPTNDSLWRLSHSYVDMDEVRQTSNLIVTTTSLSTQDEIWSQLFLLFLQDSPPKPKIKKLAKAPTTPPRPPPESPTLNYTTAPADTTAYRGEDHSLRDGTSSSSSSHQSKKRELFRMKVSWVRLSGHAFFSEPVTSVSRHGLFLNMSRNFYRFWRR